MLSGFKILTTYDLHQILLELSAKLIDDLTILILSSSEQHKHSEILNNELVQPNYSQIIF